MKKSGKAKNMSVDELAIIIAKNFDRMDTRITGLDGKFDLLQSELLPMKKDIKTIKEDIHEIKLGKYGPRIDKLEDSMRVVKTALKIR